jgi:hypothetical protein
MSIIDNALIANQAYAKKYDRKLGGRPNTKIAVVTCMDPRLSDLPGMLGLTHAAHRFHSCDWIEGDHDPESHRLRIHDIY